MANMTLLVRTKTDITKTIIVLQSLQSCLELSGDPCIIEIDEGEVIVDSGRLKKVFPLEKLLSLDR